MYCTEVSLHTLSVIAATLANAGVCPLTNEQVFSAEAVRDLLALMYASGMDQYSGEFDFAVGFPAKVSFGGVIMTIIPGVMGICTLEEPVDELVAFYCYVLSNWLICSSFPVHSREVISKVMMHSSVRPYSCPDRSHRVSGLL